jgi:hypothetical protein
MSPMKPRTRRQLRFVAAFSAYFVALWLLWPTTFVYPLKVFVVLLHEISHALAGLATGGSVVRIELYAEEGGLTLVRGGSPFIMLSAGYLGSLLWGLALLLAAHARPRRARMALAALASFVALVALLYVRNPFGILFTLLAAAALTSAARLLRPGGVAAVLTALGLTSALYALLDVRSDVLARPHLPSDAVMLSELTGVPAVAWGVL